jgi:hypothetical protein
MSNCFLITDSLVTLVRCQYKNILYSQYLHLSGVYSLEPPIRVCMESGCGQSLRADASVIRDRELVEPKTYAITVFTKEFGSVPGYATSRYCRHTFLLYIIDRKFS